jgi:ferredoxin
LVSIEPLKQTIEVEPNELLLSAINKQRLNVPFLCGGKGLCATCHVYLREGTEANASPITPQEEATLRAITGSRPNSRLACQTRVLQSGLTVEVPEAMYVGSMAELEALIGRRAGVALLHPRTGEVLIEKGKLILRSTLEQLAARDISFSELTHPSERNPR